MATGNNVIDRQKIADFCRRHHMRRHSLFGGRHVDMIDPQFIKPRLRERILNAAEVQYEREG